MSEPTAAEIEEVEAAWADEFETGNLDQEDDTPAARRAYLVGWLRSREQAEQAANAAEEQEADIRDRIDRAGALGRHLHAYYAEQP